MNEAELLEKLNSTPDTLLFSDVLETINNAYSFRPTAFGNGPLHNSASENQGSCRVFAFARRHQLDDRHTLLLFAEHYRQVRETPEGNDHANIRAFMVTGRDGVSMHGEPLQPRN